MLVQKKKILFFLPLPPPIHGAALRNKSLIDSRLINETFLLEVLPFNFITDSADMGKLSLKKLFKFITRAYQIIYKVTTFKPDLVYFNFSVYGIALYRDAFYVFLFKTLNCKLLFHLRTQGVSDQARKSILKKKMFQYVFNNTNIICLSKYLTNDIKGVYTGQPIVVNNGIEDVSLKFQNIKSDNHPPRILFLSNLAKSKGIMELIEALKNIRDKGIHFQSFIVGAPVDLSIQELKDVVEQNTLTQVVHITGPIYGDKKFVMIRESDIFVLPTYFEAFPGVILEAMQFGVPVISTFEGAIPEIVDDGETGFLIEKYDTKGLADKMEILINQPELRKEFGMKARKKFETHFTMEIFEKEMKSVFQRLIEDQI